MKMERQKVALLPFNRTVGETNCDGRGNREREANNWAVGYNTIPEAPCKGTIAQHIAPQRQMVRKVNEINTYLKATVSKVKEDNNLKETATTNGPEGTVSQKTQQSVQLLLRGVNRLLENINTINPEFAKHIDWSTLLTTIVENLHAVPHFRHETFSVLQYVMDLCKGVNG